MKTYVIAGRTGVGKSSFVNSVFGIELAKVDPYRACTTAPEPYHRKTPFGDIRIVDTPGLAEAGGEHDPEYLEMIHGHVKSAEFDAFIYVSPLNETRFYDDEQGSIKKLTDHLGGRIWKSSLLVLTFAASVPSERRWTAALQRHCDISRVVLDLSLQDSRAPRFTEFRQVLLIDNVVPDWTDQGRPAAEFLA